MKAIEPNVILRIVDLTMRFGGAVALERVSLAVPQGIIGGLIGPNGAGKSTLFNLIAGERAPSSGRIYLGGKRVDHRPAHTRLADGLGRTFQIPRPFAAMSVLENVMLAAPRQIGEQAWANLVSPRRVRQGEARILAQARELLDFVALAPLARAPAAALSGGQLKLLELARVLMAAPRLVLLDEPAAGVHPALLETLAGRLEALNRDGVTFLIVEHNMSLVSRLCSHVWALNAGSVLCEGAPPEVMRDTRVRSAYLGEEVA